MVSIIPAAPAAAAAEKSPSLQPTSAPAVRQLNCCSTNTPLPASCKTGYNRHTAACNTFEAV